MTLVALTAFLLGVAVGLWLENERELRRLKRELKETKSRRVFRRRTPSEAFAEVEQRYWESERRRELEKQRMH
jgi:hypothetical protein